MVQLPLLRFIIVVWFEETQCRVRAWLVARALRRHGGRDARDARATFVKGQMIDDEWWIRYRFVSEVGVAFEAAVGTGYDAVHGAFSGDTSFMDEVTAADALVIRYLAHRPERHLVTLPSCAGVQAGHAVPECLTGPPRPRASS